MDTWMGRNHDPVTLHKYLYANADPGNMVDPTGNFSIGSSLSALNVLGNLVTGAQTAYQLFNIATGNEEFSARQLGLSILLSRVPGSSFARKVAAKFKARTGRNLRIPCVRNSFVSGTLVHTMRGLVPIEEIIMGDFVLSYNEQMQENEYQEVVHLIQHDNDYELVKIDTEKGETFLSTLEHPFYVEGSWTDAGDLVSTNCNWLTALSGSTPITLRP